MADEKELMKKDLLLIIQIDNKLQYHDIASVQKIYNATIQKSIFKTNLGKRYINKLEQIINGTDAGKCVFCGKALQDSGKTVICIDCASKYIKKPNTTSEKQVTNKSVVTENKNTKVSENSTNKINDFVENVKVKGKAIDKETRALQKNIAENENVKNIIRQAEKLTNDAKETARNNKFLNSKMNKIKEFWHSRTKKQKYVIAGIVAVLFLGVIGTNIGSTNSSEHSGSAVTSVNSEKEALKYVQAEYPEKEGWTIRGGETIKVLNCWMMTPIGKTVKYTENQISNSNDSQLIQDGFAVTVECWCYSVHRRGKNLVEQGQILVSPDGKMFCMGAFDGVPLQDVFFRIK